MKTFTKGLFTGILFKHQLHNIIKIGLNLFHEIKKIGFRKQICIDGIDNIDFICKITNFDLFNEVFPDNMGKYKVQPQWEYYDKKNVIKTKLDTELINYLNKKGESNKKEECNKDIIFTIKELFDFKNKLNERFVSLYLPFFEKIGTNYLFIKYTYLGKKYINIYDSDTVINMKDFNCNLTIDTNFNTKYNSILCSSIKYNTGYDEKTEYISSYLKKFYNNKIPLNLELLLLNYHLNINLKNVKLNIIKNNEILELNLNEFI